MKLIGQCDIKEITEHYGTPLYVYDRQRIEENYLKLKNSLDKYYPKNRIHFSVKANSNIRILEVFKDLKSGVDCSSPNEYLLAKKAGFVDDEILYTGNYEAITDFEQVAKKGVRLNLDDISSLDRLLKVKTPEIVSFRINPGIGRGGYEAITTAGADAKFGVPYEKAKLGYKKAQQAGIKRFGVHMMTGSNNLEPYFFAEILEKLMKIAGKMFSELGIQPEYFDIGGGLGVPYEDFENELNVDEMAKLVSQVIIENSKKYGFAEPELVFEPGRYLVANAGYLVSSVTAIKESYRTFVGLNAGMNTLLRPALYGAKHRVYVYDSEQGTGNFVNICGQICENSDIFAQHCLLPDVEEGSIVIFRDTGAYGYVMASNYNNRLRPAEVLVEGKKSRLIRRAETFDDVMNLYDI